MTKRLIIADDFLPSAQVESLHGQLMLARFADELEPTDGTVYPNICKEHHPDGVEVMLGALHGSDQPVDIKLSCYRLGLKGERDDTFCHADGIYAEWASVLYLTKVTRSGGTAFWTQMATGLDALPDDEALKAQGFDLKTWHAFMTNLTRVQQGWDMQAFAGFKFNRLVTYPCKTFHSRIPGTIDEPFGDTVTTGRLIWVAFYNLR